MASPNDRRYTKTHEWHKLEDGNVTLGISKFAVEELTDITFVEVKKKSGPIKAGEAFGEIESVKATSELYSGIDGTIIAFNQAAIDNPAIINDDPFGKGWLLKITPSSPAQLDGLLSASDYDGKRS
jgi:glycine cleavage system H protein